MNSVRKIGLVAVAWIGAIACPLSIGQDQQSAAQPRPETPPVQSQTAAPPAGTAQPQPSANSSPSTTRPPDASGEKPTQKEKVPQKKSARKRHSRSAHHAGSSTSPRKGGTEQRNTATQAPAQPGKVVVRNGGVKDTPPQLSPAMPQEQQLHDRENTAQLLSTTDANLKTVAGRQLSPAQQSMLDQIHTYVHQAKEASDSGDLARAHTLAYKAHLLSDELAKK